ncbi:MAG: DUF5777 family beta-barrel protein [Acidobacteria bacterium]|nr:DUF5777 family beta-barrel protein [Acidobacteriota bacterium]
MTPSRVLLFVTALAVGSCWPLHVAAQGAARAPQVEDDPDLDLNPLQPDFVVITMPTTLRLPKYKSSFRVTHRFGRPLGAGDFGNLVEDLFGLDSGAQIGLEYRFGLMRGTQAGFHRTSDRTIEFFAQHDLMQERDGRPVSLAVIGTVDGTNNFRDRYTPALGVTLSRQIQGVGAVYVQPIWVNNSNPLPSERADNDDSFLLGVGTRLRVRPTVYLVAEFIPRVAGYDPGANQAAFGVEKRAGGHSFQLAFSNGFGTTMGQIARGGTANDDWYLGFHISRKFF